MSTVSVRGLWRECVELETRGSREKQNLAAEKLAFELAALPPEEVESVVSWMCAQVVDEGIHASIREPLFGEIVLPTLAAMHQRREPGAARWLASFAMRIAGQPRYARYFEQTSEVFFLNRALVHDPLDELALRRLVTDRAQFLQYTVHEVPAGVLFGANGATEAQCGELLEELDVFQQLVSRAELNAEYAELILSCRYHYHAYKDYLHARARWLNYADYLKNHPIK